MDRKQIKKLMEGNINKTSCVFPEWYDCSDDMRIILGVLHNIGKDASLQEFKEELERVELERQGFDSVRKNVLHRQTNININNPINRNENW